MCLEYLCNLIGAIISVLARAPPEDTDQLPQWKCCEQINRGIGHDYLMIIHWRNGLKHPRKGRLRRGASPPGSRQDLERSLERWRPCLWTSWHQSRISTPPPHLHLLYAAQVFQFKLLFASFPWWLTQFACECFFSQDAQQGQMAGRFGLIPEIFNSPANSTRVSGFDKRNLSTSKSGTMWKISLNWFSQGWLWHSNEVTFIHGSF